MLTRTRLLICFFAVLLLVAYTIAAISQTTWDRHASNPVLSPGAPGAWDDTLAVVNTVLFHENMYKMWYEGNNSFGYATSPSGIAWIKHPSNPVMVPGGPGAWDEADIDNASVIALGDTFHMWYSGVDGEHDNRIGHATSPDGIAWTKDPANPVLDLGPVPSWDDHEAMHPFVMYEDGTFKMWYNGHDGLTQRILYATSPDGTNWTRFTSLFMLEHGAAGRWDDYELGMLCVLRANDGYHMWYTGWNDQFEIRIGYATSPNETEWTKDTIHNPVLMPGAPGSWDDWGVALPYVMLIDSVLTMWYGGADADTFRTGVATSISDLVPTLLRAHTAAYTGTGIEVRWELSELEAGAEFRVLRSQLPKNDFVALDGATILANGMTFSFVDRDVRPGATYRYAVEASDHDGRTLLFETDPITTPVVSLSLDPIYPNPFNPQTTIAYTIAEPGLVTIGVYDAGGRLVRVLVNEPREAGPHTTSWNGLNAEGVSVASGVYFIRLESGNQVQTRKAVLTK